MKLEDLPDFTKKYKIKGYDVKKIGNEYYQYKIEHYRTPDKSYPVTKSIYIGKIDKEKGLIKANSNSEDVVVYLEYGLSNYIFKNYKRALQRSLFNISGEHAINLIKLGIINFIYNEVSLSTLRYSYLTYFEADDLLEFYNSNNQNQIRTTKIENKIDELLSKVFLNDEDRKALIISLKNMNAIIYDNDKKVNEIYPNNVKSIFKKYKVKYE